MGLSGQNPAAPGFGVEPDEATQVRRMRDAERAIQQIFADGTLRAVLDQLPATVAASIAASVATALLSVTGNATIGGTLGVTGISTLTGGITSTGVSGTNVTLLPGSRSQLWIVDATGVMGQTTSSIRYKTDLQEVPYTADQYLSVMPLLFKYIGQIAIRDDPDNEYYDPTYEVPVEVGLIAEHLVDAGLPLYVLYEADGVTPTNIDYPTFGVHAALVIGRNHEARLADIEARLDQR